MCKSVVYTFIVHVHDLNYTSGVTGHNAAKPVTAVQDCAPTFVKPLDGFDEGPQGLTF